MGRLIVVDPISRCLRLNQSVLHVPALSPTVKAQSQTSPRSDLNQGEDKGCALLIVMHHRSSRNKRVYGGKEQRNTQNLAKMLALDSSEDLIHRLYVCISGAADQLQTNFAGDFRSILKYVFIMNSTVDEEEETAEQDDKSQESS